MPGTQTGRRALDLRQYSYISLPRHVRKESWTVSLIQCSKTATNSRVKRQEHVVTTHLDSLSKYRISGTLFLHPRGPLHGLIF